MFPVSFQGLLPVSGRVDPGRDREDEGREGHEEVGRIGGGRRRRVLEATASDAPHF